VQSPTDAAREVDINSGDQDALGLLLDLHDAV
jgi:hypothetical protein